MTFPVETSCFGFTGYTLQFLLRPSTDDPWIIAGALKSLRGSLLRVNGSRKLLRFSSLLTLLVATVGCIRGIPPAEVPTPSATGIPSPYPAAYAWVRAQLDGDLKGEFVVGDPQDSYERVRGRVEGEELAVELGFPSRGVRFKTPPLKGGARYILRKGEGQMSLTIDGAVWSTEAGGVCSIVFSYVRGPQIRFSVPEGHRVYEADAGFVCAALKRAMPQSFSQTTSSSVRGEYASQDPAQPTFTESAGDQSERLLSVTEGFLHFFFVVPPREVGSLQREPFSSQPTSTLTAAPTG